MKQGDRFLKILMFVLAAVVAAYFGYAAWGYFSAPLATVTALEYEADTAASVTGYVVRDEALLTSGSAITVPVRSEGERVGSGQTIAVAYGSADARQRQAGITNLQRQIRQLTVATDSSVSDAALESRIAGLLKDYAAAGARGRSEDAEALGTELKGLILRSEADEAALEALDAERQTLEQELAALTAQGGGGQALTSATPGWFSGAADGYEAVLTPERLETMTLSDYDDLDGAAEAVSGQVYGRLVRSAQWYFVAAVDETQLGDAAEDDWVTLSLTRDACPEIRMRILRIDRSEDGRCLLVLTGGSYLQHVTALRRQTATVIFRADTGLRVPKDALQTDETGQTGVYILEGAVARWKPVELLCEMGDNCVVRLDQSSTANLWPGDEIILGNNLYDGKVVNP